MGIFEQKGNAELRLPSGETLTLPMYEGTKGPQVIDVRPLKTLDLFTYDPGFIATASCASRITYIDGEKGELLYRGYPIEQLAEHSDFVECCYLLYHGELPTPRQFASYREKLTYHTMVTVHIEEFIRRFRSDAHPMSIIAASVGGLASFYHDWIDVKNPNSREVSAMRLVAKVPTIAAMAFKYCNGYPSMYPQNELGFVENVLYMMFGTPCERYEPDPVLSRALDKILILHADHEQNASTSTVRLAGSTNANPFACVAAGIAALWGPSHGGANEAVLKMLAEIGDASRIPAFIDEVKDEKSNRRLMGFGHRVYKNHDPRATVLRKTCAEVLGHLDIGDDPMFEIALELERIALDDEYFVKRRLYPNVDFYSGIILKAMKIPVSMFTAIFAIARTIGWVSQWNELMEDPEFRIGRPRQLYMGPTRRDYVAAADRGGNGRG